MGKGFNEELEIYFTEKEVTFYRFPSEKLSEYKSLQRFYRLVESQWEFWNEWNSEAKKNNVEPLVKIRNHWYQIRQNLVSANNQRAVNLENAKKSIDDAVEQIKINSFPLLFSETEEAKFIENLVTNYSSMTVMAFIDTFFEDIRNIDNNKLSNPDYHLGIQIAHQFKYPSLVNDFYESHRKASEDIMEVFESENNMFVENLREENNDLREEIGGLSKKIGEEKEILNNLKLEKEEEFSDLENLYKEKLKLEEPAKYWKEAAESYKKRGEQWKNWTLGIASIYIIVLSMLLLIAPSTDTFDFESVKLTLILTVIISMGFLLINLFIKLSTSNYHLANDAEERHHLTYVYLALLNEKEDITSEERNTVLQALFSRADSGLTKSDGGTQMPGAQAINTFLKNNRQ